MVTSGSVNFSINRNEIITEAMELAGVLDLGSAATAAQITSCARTLNIMIKAWQASGVSLWKTQDFYVIPQYSTGSMDLGPSGDHASLTYYQTTLASDAAASASTVTVTTDDNITDGDYIGIQMDNNQLHWTTVNGAPSSDVVALTAAMAAAASEGGYVYNYTTKINRPLWIMEKGRVLLSGGNENPFTIVARNDYNRISTKTSTGTPNQGHYEPRTTDGKLYIWPESNNVQNILILTGCFPLEDFDASTNDADFPQEWYLALTHNLAVMIAPKFIHRDMDPSFQFRAAQYLKDVADFDKDYGSLYIEME